MSDHDNGQEPATKERIAKTLAERVRAIQEQAGQEGFVSLNGSDDKAFMDEAWGEDGDGRCKEAP